MTHTVHVIWLNNHIKVSNYAIKSTVGHNSFN